MEHPYLDDLLGGVDRDNGGMYGMGVYIDRDELGDIYYHGGFMPGYLSRIVYYPEYRFAIAVQINRDYLLNLVGLTEELASIVINGH